MHLSLAAAVLATLASATTYSLSVYSPGLSTHGAPLHAASQGFYIGMNKPATYCPMELTECPEVEGTLVTSNMGGMAVTVPGGQRIYVHPSGEVKYTQAHSAYMPLGSVLGGWYNKTVVSGCAPTIQILDFFSPDKSGITGLVLCSDIDEFLSGTGASYQLYARTPEFNRTGCEAVLGLTMHGNSVDSGCWQYM